VQRPKLRARPRLPSATAWLLPRKPRRNEAVLARPCTHPPAPWAGRLSSRLGAWAVLKNGYLSKR
jgi:hypothetical protein